MYFSGLLKLFQGHQSYQYTSPSKGVTTKFCRGATKNVGGGSQNFTANFYTEGVPGKKNHFRNFLRPQIITGRPLNGHPLLGKSDFNGATSSSTYN